MPNKPTPPPQIVWPINRTTSPSFWKIRVSHPRPLISRNPNETLEQWQIRVLNAKLDHIAETATNATRDLENKLVEAHNRIRALEGIKG